VSHATESAGDAVSNTVSGATGSVGSAGGGLLGGH
jgi:hypothetical protein